MESKNGKFHKKRRLAYFGTLYRAHLRPLVCFALGYKARIPKSASSGTAHYFYSIIVHVGH